MWRRHLEYLGNSEEDDLTKLLLRSVAGGDELGAYRKFLASTLNTNLSHANLANLSPSLLGRFFGAQHRLASPRYLDLRNSRDLARLEDVLDVRLVIARTASKSSEAWTKVSDRRVYDVVFAGGAHARTEHFFALDYGKDKRWDLYRVPEAHRTRYYSPSASESSLIRRGLLFGDCLLTATLLLLERPPPPPGHVCSPDCKSLTDLCASAEARTAAGVQVLFVSHLASSTIATRSSRLPKHQFFGRLGILRGPEEPLSSEAAVLCLTSDGRMYAPHQDVAEFVLGPKKPRRLDPRTVPYPGMDEVVLDRKKRVPAAAAVGSCPSCKESTAYAANMAAAGPQKHYSTPLSTSDLLYMTALDTEDNVAAVLECCRVGMCFFDLESFTEAAHFEPGNEDVSFEFVPLSQTHLERRLVATQRPMLAGHVDALDLSSSAEPEITKSDAGPDDLIRRFAVRMVERRDVAVAHKHRLLAGLFSKLRLFRKAHLDFFASEGYAVPPLVTDRSRTTEEEEEEEEEDDLPPPPKKRSKAEKEEQDPTERLLADKEERQRLEVDQSWRSSLLGRLEENLARLEKKYLVWSFAGERYDMPLLAATLTVFFREQGVRNIKMSREGG
jgi:hypothetical protein